jgi:tetratricopeptide (TPR) repeat protein
MPQQTHRSRKTPADLQDLGAALDAMSADELRAFVRGLVDNLDAGRHATLEATLLEHASRGTSRWRPSAPAKGLIAEVETFVSAARRIHQADPEEVDAYLRQGVKAFLAGDFATARAVFGTLLPPLEDAEIDLGQQELLDEVLTESLRDCAARYAVAVYWTTPLEQRPDAVFEAMKTVGRSAFRATPLADMERVAMKPLPELDAFLPRWVTRLEREPSSEGPWESERDRMLREAVSRAEGVAGLERLARASRKPEALQAWCSTLTERRQWPEALRAYEEAAELAPSSPSSLWRGDFLDGAALAASRLGRTDLSRRLKAAWLEAPCLVRLLRWLEAGAPEVATLKRRATLALGKCPTKAPRLVGLLLVLAGDIASAAALLTQASGLGWSHEEHPGHLLFPAFAWLLGGAPAGTLRGELARPLHHPPTQLFGLTLDLGSEDAGAPTRPALPTPSVIHVLQRSHAAERLTAKDRSTMLEALRSAASTRTDVVISHKRRRAYVHAAMLIACSVELEALAGHVETGARWVAELRERTRRFPAFQEALRKALGRARGAPHRL